MLWTPPSRGERAVRASPVPLHGPAEPVARAAGARADRVHGRVARLAAAGPDGRPRLLPGRRCRHAASARAHAARDAHRGDRAAVRRRRAGDPRHAAGRRARHHPRQHRDPERVGQPRAGRRAEHRRDRRRDSHLAQSRAPRAGARVRSPAAQAAGREVSRHGVLLRAGEHHEPDSELRPARADRRAGGRQQRRRRTTRSRSGCGGRSPPFPARPTCTSTRCTSSRS